MAQLMIALCFLIAFSTICTGSPADKCPRWKIDECVEKNKNTNGCVFHGKVISCINEFFTDCRGQNMQIASEEINVSKSQKSACPGLPDGQCYFAALSDCITDLKMPASFYDEKKTPSTSDCTSFAQSAKKSKDCLGKLKAACVVADVDPSLKVIDSDMKKICGHA